MVEVEVLIPNFKDKENFGKKITIKRDGREVEVENELLQPGDIYPITKERYQYLSQKNIVKRIVKDKKKED